MRAASTIVRGALCTALVLLLGMGSKAQVASYAFSQSSSTYTPLSGGTVYGTSTSDDQRFMDPAVPAGTSGSTGVGIPIGFNFVFNGDTFDRIGINNNGWISFGKSALTPSVNMNSSSSYYCLSSTTAITPAALRNRVAGIARDLQSRAGATITVETIGTAPNQVCVVEWANYRRYGQTGDTLNFQIRLNETTNVVEVVFGNIVFSTLVNHTGNSSSPQIGLGGSVAADFNSRTTTTDWNNTVAAALNTNGCDVISGVLYPVPGLVMSWTPPVPCAGAPIAGTATAGSDSVCSGVSFPLSLDGSSSGLTGLSYQWFSSPDDVVYTAMSGDTSATVAATQTSGTFYRCVVTCTAGGQSDTSTAVYVALNPLYYCYCTSGATSTADEDIFNVSLGSLNNSSSCSTTGTGASVLMRYSDFTTTVAAPQLQQATAYPLSVAIGTCGTGSYNNVTGVYIDWNGNGLYTDPGEQVYLTSTVTPGAHTESTTILVPANAQVGLTGMRVITVESSNPGSITPCGTYSWGETEDYIVEITQGTGCVGAPTAGAAVSSSDSVCQAANANLSLNGATTGVSGLTYQWLSSSDNLNYNYLAGDTAPIASVSINEPSYFRCIVTCSFSGLSDTSAEVYVALNPQFDCYCTSSANYTSDEDIFNVSIGSLNNSSTCATTGTGASILNRYSDYTDTVPAVELQRTVSYPLSVQIGTCGGSYSNMSAVYIDYNRNGSFGDPGEQVYISPTATTGAHTETATITVPLTADTGLTLMRVITEEGSSPVITPCGTYGWGETEDYLVNITEAPPCAAPANVSIAEADTFATISFTSSAIKTSVEYGPVGFTPGQGTVIDSVVSPFIISGLLPQTSYAFYLQNTCVDTFSLWGGPYVFTTKCSPFPTPGNGLANAIVVTGAYFTDTLNTTACYENNSPLRPSNDVFFLIPGDSCVSSITASFCGSSYDTYIYVVAEDSSVVASNDDFCGPQSQVTFTPTPGATYAVIAEGYGTAGGTLVTTITRTFKAPMVTVGSTPASCQGVANGSAWVTITQNAIQPLSYTWSNGANTDTIANISDGTYYVTVTTPCGSVVDTVVVGTTFYATAVATDAGCFGSADGAVDLTVVGGAAPYTFIWTNGDTTEDIANLSANTYSVTVNDNGGCSFALSADVTQPDTLTVTGTVTGLMCYGDTTGSIELTVAGGTRTAASGQLNTTFAGGNGCSGGNMFDLQTNMVVSLTQFDVNMASTGPQSVNIYYKTGSYLGSETNAAAWTLYETIAVNALPQGTPTPAILANPLTLPAGQYAFFVNANVQYTNQAVGTTYSTPEMTLTVGAGLCNLFSTVNAGRAWNGNIHYTYPGAYSYSWSNGDTTQDLLDVPVGAYDVTVTDLHGCTATGSYAIVNPNLAPLVAAIDSSFNATCNGLANGAIYLTTTGGTAPYTFSWTSGSSDEDIANLPAGVYVATVTDDHGCTTQVTDTITEPSALVLVADSLQSVVCPGDSTGAIYVSASGGTGNISFAWANGATTSSLVNVAAGVYSVTATDDNGCEAALNNLITEPDAFVTSVDSLTGTLCFGDNTGYAEVSVIGGTYPYSFAWSNGDTAEVLSDVSAGSYTLTITDASGCTVVPSVVVPGPTAALAATSVATDQIQNGSMGSIDVTVSGGTAPYDFNWSDGKTTEDINGLTAGAYSCTITDANGCSIVVRDTVSLISGISTVTANYTVDLYPNPTQSQLTVAVSLPTVNRVGVVIYSIDGKIIQSLTEEHVLDAKFVVSFANEAAGVYVAKVTVGDETTTHRVVVAK